MITVEQIRTAFPYPSTDTAPTTACYCVGGAFLITQLRGIYPYWAQPVEAYPLETRFPTRLALGNALRRANTALSWDRAHEFATYIVDNNDRGFFDTAWDILGDALTYQRKED